MPTISRWEALFKIAREQTPARKRTTTAKPELMYPETAALKSTRSQGAATLHNTQQDIVTLVSL
jgi:hypothetical protein